MPGLDLRIPIKKSASSGEVTGWAAMSTDAEGLPVIDWDGDYIPIDVLKEAAHQFMRDGGQGKAGEMHEGTVGHVVESMIIDKAKAKALGFGEAEGWLVTLKILDAATRERIEAGELRELSIGGKVIKKVIAGVNVITKMLINEISAVDEGASGNDKVSPRIVIAKRRDSSLIRKFKAFFKEKTQMPKTPEEILAGLPPEDAAVLIAAMEAIKQAQPAPEPAAEPIAKAEDEPKEEPKPEMTEKEKEMSQDLAKAKKRLDELEDEREFVTFQKRAAKLPCLAGSSTDKIAKLLQSASKKIDKSEFEDIYKMLEERNETISKSKLFRNDGSPLPDDSETDEGKLVTIAKQRAKDDKISYEKAYVLAATDNPEMVGAK